MAAIGMNSQAFAQDSAEQNEAVSVTRNAQDVPAQEQPVTLHKFDDAPGVAVSVEHIDVIVENKELSVRSRRAELDGVLIEASPIFTHLKGKVSVEGTVLSFIRYQDGATLTIDMETGAAGANGQILGALPNFKAREQADTWLSPNAISFLTGTIAKEDDLGRWTFELTEQLRPKFDLDLWIEGQQITNPLTEPRSIGPVLLVPLEIVVEALGHTLTRPDENTLEVLRIQDSARITLDLNTGLITVNNIARGVTPNIAFAEPDTLLLPFTAVETLTGTHIELLPGSDRIDVTLDERLGGGVLPGERVADDIAATGFVAESLEFQASDRGPIDLTFASHVRGLNTQLDYVSAGGFDNASELVPARVTLNVQSVDGWVGSLGDANTRFRELAGVRENRIRGVTFRKQSEKTGNLIALAAGATTDGAVEVSEDASRPTFGGFAVGARRVAADQSHEIGASLAVEPGGDNVRVVAGGQRLFTLPDNEQGWQSAFVDGDVGFFRQNGRNKVDARGRIQLRYRVNEQIGVQANADYEGASFISSNSNGLAETTDLEGALGDSNSSRFVGSLSTDWRSVKDWGPISNVAAGVRATYNRGGGASTTAVTGSVNGQVPSLGLSLSADTNFSQTRSSTAETITSSSIGLRAFKRFNWGTVRATYNNDNTDGENTQRLVSSVNTTPIRKVLGKGASVSAGPSASFVWTPGEVSARFGASLSANSGQAFGNRFNMQAQVSALQSIDPENPDTQFFATLTSTYAVTRNVQVQSSYVDTFDGNRDFSIALRGRVVFNEPRRHTRPKDGLGVLKGRVFFDRNRDGIRQDDEPGVSGVRVQVSNTRLGLRVDQDGNFTIQNMKEGLYGLVVDRRSLPLGLLVPDDVSARATVGEGRITHLEIPIIASGQIRGAVFIDENSDGELTPGEQRIEGTYITLTKTGETTGEDGEVAEPHAEGGEEDEPVSLLSASFGQYSFENLSPSTYELSVNYGGRVYSHSVELTEDDLFAVKPFSLPASVLEDGGGGITFDGELTATT